MPLHCAPLSRRQFLRRSVFGGLAVLTWRQSSYAAGVDANRWALFSDTHIAADPATVRLEVNMTDHLRTSVAEVRARETRPAGLIVNGDCPYDAGLPGDYTQFIELLKPIAALEIPMHFTLGNHDNREVFWESLAGQAALPRPVAAKQVSVIETPVANWILLDSLEATKLTPGLLGPEQLDWLAQTLDAQAAKPTLVMVHHNPISAHPEKPTGLKDGEALLALLQPRRQVKALFFGHTHHWGVTEQEGLFLVNLPAVAYPFKKGDVTGWVDCRLADGRMSLEVRAQDKAHPDHGKVKELAWRG